MSCGSNCVARSVGVESGREKEREREVCEWTRREGKAESRKQKEKKGLGRFSNEWKWKWDWDWNDHDYGRASYTCLRYATRLRLMSNLPTSTGRKA